MNCPYCCKQLNTWVSVRGHTSSCTKNTGEYYIHIEYGPIYYQELNEPIFIIKNKYPNLGNLTTIKSSFRKRGFVTNYSNNTWSKEKIIYCIQKFYLDNDRIPQIRDWTKSSIEYPSQVTVKEHFGTWNAAIAASGYEPNFNDGFGNRITAQDGILYRSWYETEFVNKFLFEKYDYIVEPKYPEPYNRYYDWYIPALDLYIEFSGGLRPEVIQEKIEINKLLGRKLLVVTPSDLNNKDYAPVVERNTHCTQNAAP